MEYIQQFATNLRTLRNQKKMTQSTLSEKAGLHRTYINKLERGKLNPSLDSVRSLALALDATVYDLVENTDMRVNALDKVTNMWLSFGAAISDAVRLPLFLITPDGFVLKANDEFLNSTGYYEYKKDLPLINIKHWLPIYPIPIKGTTTTAKIQCRDGHVINANISFRCICTDYSIIMGTIIN